LSVLEIVRKSLHIGEDLKQQKEGKGCGLLSHAYYFFTQVLWGDRSPSAG